MRRRCCCHLVAALRFCRTINGGGSRKVINITIISDLRKTYLLVFLEVPQARECLAAELTTICSVGRRQCLQVLQFSFIVEECGVCGGDKIKTNGM